MINFLIIVTLLIIFMLIACFIINYFIFTPRKININKFSELNYETYNFKSELIKLINKKKYLYINKISPKKPNNKYVIFSHGNSSNIFESHNFIRKICLELNVTAISYDYSGYGLSTGKSSESNCYKNINDVVSYVIKKYQIEQHDIILMGRSLGTGIVIDFISKNENWPSPIILISPYKSIFRIYFDFWLPFDKFKNIDKIKKINCPVFIIHGEKDNLINIKHAQYLYNNLNNKKILPHYIKQGDHRNIINYLDYSLLDNIIKNY